MTSSDAAAPTSPADLVVVARRAVLPDGERPAAIEVRDGRIAAVHPLADVFDFAAAAHDRSTTQALAAAGVPAARQTIALTDDEVLMPALVDCHVHANEPGRTHWEGIRSITAAAAAGGIATVVDMPLNCIPATVTAGSVGAKMASCQEPSVDIGMWGGAVGGRLDGLPDLLAAGVWGLKAFMIDSGVIEFPALVDDDGLRVAMEAVAAAGVPLLVHAEDALEASRAPQPIATNRYADLLACRPVACEVKAIERLAAIAATVPGVHVHIVHVTCAEAVEAIATAQAAGIHLTGESCPHYLALNAEDLPDADPRVKCFPPIREKHHQDALWAGLADGTLSLVVSDHSPAPWPLKDTGDLGTSWGGIASIQVSLPVVWTEARRRGVPLADVTRWMAKAPAELAGLAHKGQLAPGFDADLLIFAPDATFTVRGTDLLHRHPQTPYEGRELHGVVRRTLLRGTPVDPQNPHGRWLLRDPSTPPASSPATQEPGARLPESTTA